MGCAVDANTGPAFTLSGRLVRVVRDDDDVTGAVADISLAIAGRLVGRLLAVGYVGGAAHTLLACGSAAFVGSAGAIGRGGAMHDVIVLACALVAMLARWACDAAPTAIAAVVDGVGAGQPAEGWMVRGTTVRFGCAGLTTGENRDRGRRSAREQGLDRLSTIFPFCQLASKSVETILVHNEPFP